MHWSFNHDGTMLCISGIFQRRAPPAETNMQCRSLKVVVMLNSFTVNLFTLEVMWFRPLLGEPRN